MEWEMHLYVERKVGEEWRPVCPPLATSPKGKPKWGRYDPTDPVESLASAMRGTDFIPTKAPRWDFGPHPDGQQQLAALYTNIWATGADTDERLTKLDPFLDPCGLPENVSPQVRKAGVECGMNDSDCQVHSRVSILRAVSAPGAKISSFFFCAQALPARRQATSNRSCALK